jgi:hypothetical protein
MCDVLLPPGVNPTAVKKKNIYIYNSINGRRKVHRVGSYSYTRTTHGPGLFKVSVLPGHEHETQAVPLGVRLPCRPVGGCKMADEHTPSCFILV